MKARFSFEVDPSRDLVRIKMAGFFLQQDVRAFLEARGEAHARLVCPPNQHLTINDIRGMSAQTQTTVDAFYEMLAAPDFRSRRLAFVIGPMFAHAQALRALASRSARFFNDPAAAEAWLLAEDSDEEPLREAG